MGVKIIKSEKDYEAAMARLSALMSLDPKPDSREENELELLILVIQDFERKMVPPVKTDPVESILFRMDQMELTRKVALNHGGLPFAVKRSYNRIPNAELREAMEDARLHRNLNGPFDTVDDAMHALLDDDAQD